jgi:hypothetical protein
MAKRAKGKRHILLPYQHAMERLWKAAFTLGLVLAVVWWQASMGRSIFNKNSENMWLFVGAVVSLGFALFAFLARKMSYIQPHPNHLRLATPFLRLNISYRRLRHVHPVEFHKIYPPDEMKWGRRKFLDPYWGKTAVAVELNAYPISPILLRLFLPKTIFHPRITAFVFLVESWLDFSTELDSFFGAWQDRNSRKMHDPNHKLLRSLRQS